MICKPSNVIFFNVLNCLTFFLNWGRVMRTNIENVTMLLMTASMTCACMTIIHQTKVTFNQKKSNQFKGNLFLSLWSCDCDDAAEVLQWVYRLYQIISTCLLI